MRFPAIILMVLTLGFLTFTDAYPVDKNSGKKNISLNLFSNT